MRSLSPRVPPRGCVRFTIPTGGAPYAVKNPGLSRSGAPGLNLPGYTEDDLDGGSRSRASEIPARQKSRYLRIL